MRVLIQFTKHQEDTLTVRGTNGQEFYGLGEKTGTWYQYACWLCHRASGTIFYIEDLPSKTIGTECIRCRVYWRPKFYHVEKKEDIAKMLI